MSRSIIQDKDEHYCYLCSLLEGRAWQQAREEIWETNISVGPMP